MAPYEMVQFGIAQPEIAVSGRKLYFIFVDALVLDTHNASKNPACTYQRQEPTLEEFLKENNLEDLYALMDSGLVQNTKFYKFFELSDIDIVTYVMVLSTLDQDQERRFQC